MTRKSQKPKQEKLAPRPALICRECGSTSITETWEPGVLECMSCGKKGRRE
jgi:hypothetical protein